MADVRGRPRDVAVGTSTQLAFVALVILQWCCLSTVDATIVMKDMNASSPAFDDWPANFGPDVPASGLVGFLVQADPPHACEPLKQADHPPRGPWIALVQRSPQFAACHFVHKVRHAELAGASAVIVYDIVRERPIIMNKLPGEAEPAIAAVFVTLDVGSELLRLNSPDVLTVILPSSSLPPAPDSAAWVSAIVSASMAGLAALLALLTLFALRRSREAREARAAAGGRRPAAGVGLLTPEQVKSLPSMAFRAPPAVDAEAPPADDSGDRATCVICIEDYNNGDALRELPRCGHRFHAACIETWVTTRQPCCPICKAAVLAPPEAAPARQGGQGAARRRGGDETTDPLLGDDDEPDEPAAPITSSAPVMTSSAPAAATAAAESTSAADAVVDAAVVDAGAGGAGAGPAGDAPVVASPAIAEAAAAAVAPPRKDRRHRHR